MNSLASSVKARRKNAQITIGSLDLQVAGRVLNRDTRLPVGGILVQLNYVELAPEPGAPSPKPSLLGSGLTDANGDFAVAWLPGPAIAARLCLLAKCAEARWIVSAYLDSHAPPLLTLPPAAPGGPGTRLDLLVPITKEDHARTVGGGG